MDYISFIRSKVGHDKIFLNFGSVIIYNENNEILLQHRADTGNWGLPGGAMELGETITEAAIREVAEETTIQFTSEQLHFFGIYSAWDIKYPNGDHAQAIAYMFHAPYSGQQYAINDDESLELCFFGQDNLPTIFCEQNEIIIADFYNDHNQIYIR
ncbi:NUDIX hydrolase [Culicoidibacter larvae]|uniref:NUDIX domain-containing protein n=1 Tax=Culicoidibacter larvae TaxID=2579976 RepID=A0A5R8QB47_9FIRM|nr:NUDIX domain-containing protein [Culicoidibacter larvae]TLG73799.1 NUDIX domain-containing protein [Culicoidibacter larvae]